MELKDITSAKKIFNRIIKEDPKNYTALMNLGNIAFHNEKKYSEAARYFQSCIYSNKPNLLKAYTNLGTVALIQKQSNKAIEYFEKSLNYGASKGTYGNLHLLWKEKGNTEKSNYYKSLYNKN